MCFVWPGVAEQGGWCLPAGISAACFWPGNLCPAESHQADASVALSPSLLLFPFMISSWPEAQGSRARAQGLSLRNHVALQLGVYFLNILSAELGKGRNGGSAYREVAVVGLLHLSCQF